MYAKLFTVSNTFPISTNTVVLRDLVSTPKKAGGENIQLNCTADRKSPPIASHSINLPGIAFAAQVFSALPALYVNGPKLEPLKPLTVPFPPAKYLL